MRSSDLTEHEVRLLDLIADPVAWAETFLRNPEDASEPLELRWYQREILQAKTARRAVRIGRRAGKTITLAVYALYCAFTRPGCRVLVVAPYESQIQVVFDDAIRKMLYESPAGESVTADRSSPFFVEFSNKASILGMTAGSRSGQHGSSIRGQSAHVLIIDEADYLSPQSITAIEAILASHKETEIWVSSTPTGKRSWFYTVCTDKHLRYRESHYASSVSPEWTPEIEADLRRTTSPEDYLHEYDAEWGEQALGVFNPVHIDAGLRTYQYADIPIKKLPGNVRIMGVDWNAAKHGVQIVIVEYSTGPTPYPFVSPVGETRFEELTQHFVVIHRASVTDKEMTQHKARRTILKLMADYQIDFIYVDEGYGHTNVEDLYLDGERYPTLLIKKKLKAINMSKKITLQDPLSQLLVEKPIKPYMVHQAQLRVEERVCIFPEHEDCHTGLVGQMRDYVVMRISDKGYPTYSEQNDHALVAWMLAMLGFAEEYSELKHQPMTRTIVAVPPEKMALNQPATWGGSRDDDDPVHPRPSAVIQKAITALGLEAQHVYAGYDPALHDDSDEALERRKRVHRLSQMRPIWRISNKRRKYGPPTRQHVTSSGVSTPWSGR